MDDIIREIESARGDGAGARRRPERLAAR